MALTNFVDRSTVVYANWLNSVDRVVNGTSSDAGSLAASTGAGLVGIPSFGVGAPSSNFNTILPEIYYLTRAGGGGDKSAAENDAAFARLFAHIGTDGGVVILPDGDINISATITPPFNVSLRGQGVRATLLRMNTLNLPAITLSAGFITIYDLGILYAGTPTSGAIAINVVNADNYITNVKIFNAYDGIKYTASGQKASAITIQDCVNTGIFCKGCADVYIDNFLVTTSVATNFANGGIRLEDKAEAILLNNGSVLGGEYSFVTGAAVYAQDVRPAYNHFVNVFFDSGSKGVFLDKLAVTKFIGCWFSGGRTGIGYPGMHLSQSNSVTFESCQFFNCGSHGAFVDSLASGAIFKTCLFADNSVTVAASGARGILIAANVSDFIIQGCQATNGLFSSGDQGFGIVVSGGTSDRYIIADNLVTGNAVGGVFDGGAGVNKRVANNY